MRLLATRTVAAAAGNIASQPAIRPRSQLGESFEKSFPRALEPLEPHSGGLTPRTHGVERPPSGHGYGSLRNPLPSLDTGYRRAAPLLGRLARRVGWTCRAQRRLNRLPASYGPQVNKTGRHSVFI